MAVFVMALPVTLLPLSMVIPIVSGLTPESLSVTFQRIAGLLLMISALAVGYVIVMIGATFSFTWSCRLLPSVASVSFFCGHIPGLVRGLDRHWKIMPVVIVIRRRGRRCNCGLIFLRGTVIGQCGCNTVNYGLYCLNCHMSDLLIRSYA